MVRNKLSCRRRTFRLFICVKCSAKNSLMLFWPKRKISKDISGLKTAEFKKLSLLLCRRSSLKFPTGIKAFSDIFDIRLIDKSKVLKLPKFSKAPSFILSSRFTAKPKKCNCLRCLKIPPSILLNWLKSKK